jgi:hypothetical protein
MTTMIAFIAGLVLGASFGVLLAAMLWSAKRG